MNYYLALTLLAGLGSAGKADASYYLTAQLHPLVEVRVELNGKEVDSFRSTGGKSKVFARKIDPSLLKPGLNKLVIHWEILEGEVEEQTLIRTGYRISLKHQRNSRDRRTAVEFVTVAGLEVPLPKAGTSGSDRLNFEALLQ